MNYDSIYKAAYNAAQEMVEDYNMADDKPKPAPKKTGDARMKEIEREHAKMMKDHKKFEKQISNLQALYQKLKERASKK